MNRLAIAWLCAAVTAVSCFAPRAEIVDAPTTGGSGGGAASAGMAGEAVTDGGRAAEGGEQGFGGGAVNGPGGEVGNGGTPAGGGGAPSVGIAGEGGSAGDIGVAGTGGSVPGSSCDGMLGNECRNESCCASSKVTGGSFTLGGNVIVPTSQAKISTYYLDKYEVTVGRFRKYLETFDGPPAAGGGKHPKITGSGWDASWPLPVDATAFKTALKCNANATWTDAKVDAARDALPINCANYYQAFAFCVWDGGRLPTEAEWEYAASGGSLEYAYAWGNEALDDTRAVFNCNGDGNTANPCSFGDLVKVGSRPAGVGVYQQYDLGGSMWEWTLDAFATYPATCNDCAELNGAMRVYRGGSWYSQAAQLTPRFRSSRNPGQAGTDLQFIGLRCAHDL